MYSLANLSCVPEELPTTKCAIKTDRNSLSCAGRKKMLSMNPKAHLHPQPNQSGKPLPQIREAKIAERRRGGDRLFPESQQL